MMGALPASPHRTPERDTAPLGVRPAWLALLAGPLSFGITGPTLVLHEVARDLDVSVVSATTLVTAFGWGIAVGTPLAGVVQARRGIRTALYSCLLLVVTGAILVRPSRGCRSWSPGPLCWHWVPVA